MVQEFYKCLDAFVKISTSISLAKTDVQIQSLKLAWIVVHLEPQTLQLMSSQLHWVQQQPDLVHIVVLKHTYSCQIVVPLSASPLPSKYLLEKFLFLELGFNVPLESLRKSSTSFSCLSSRIKSLQSLMRFSKGVSA